MTSATSATVGSSDSELTYLGWSDDVERLCGDIQTNAAQFAERHRLEYLELIHQQRYFKIPIIVLSACNSIIAVGLSAYASQDAVSATNCLLSLVCGVISSVELYIGISSKIEAELQSYRLFYNLSVKIGNCLKLAREHRTEANGVQFLTEVEGEYRALFNDSAVHVDPIADKLICAVKINGVSDPPIHAEESKGDGAQSNPINAPVEEAGCL
jgi:hypothetical protein